MHSFTKTIIFISVGIAGLFFLLRFAGLHFVSKISPDIETTKIEDDATQNSGVVKIGKEIPYFNLLTLDGGRINRTDIIGHPAVLTFWSTWNSADISDGFVFSWGGCWDICGSAKY